jgi:poly(hydroxyalkanoate) depolymerase family esterase
MAPSAAPEADTAQPPAKLPQPPTAPPATPTSVAAPSRGDTAPAPESAEAAEPGRFSAAADIKFRRSAHDDAEGTRDFLLYVPRGWTKAMHAPLLVLCHGCKQSPEDIAAGTRIAALADAQGWLVLLPRQSEQANPWGCWNWFMPGTVRGEGEAAIIARMIVRISRRYGVARRDVFVAGMSAGAALAAVLGLRYPRIVGGVIAHSGLACGAARSVLTATTVMRNGPDTDVVAVARSARSTARSKLPVPLLAIQGDADEVVSPLNATALVNQYLAFNGYAADATASGDATPQADQAVTAEVAGRRSTTNDWTADGQLVVRSVSIQGLGHAWSGGDAAYAYNDASGPAASELLAAFVGQVRVSGAVLRANGNAGDISSAELH